MSDREDSGWLGDELERGDVCHERGEMSAFGDIVFHGPCSERACGYSCGQTPVRRAAGTRNGSKHLNATDAHWCTRCV